MAYIVPNIFVAGTTIDPDAMNANFTYVVGALDVQLPRDGTAPMLAPLPLASGTLPAPGLTFSGDTDTGIYRSGANTYVFVTGGAARGTVSNAGINIPVFVAGTATVTTLNVTTLALSSPLPVASGGTGAATLTGVVRGTGTDPLTAGPIGNDDWSGDPLAVANGGTGGTDAATGRAGLNAAVKGAWESARTVVNAGTTLVKADAGGIVWMFDASISRQALISTDAAASWDARTVLTIQQIGDGIVTVRGDTGVSLNGLSGGTISLTGGAFCSVSITRNGTNSWYASGSISTVS